MNTKLPTTFVFAAAALAFVSGCTSPSASFPPQDSTKYTLENTEKFVLLDQGAQEAVTCTGLQERTLPDGRIEVVANVKNRLAQKTSVQIDCVFRDDQGFALNPVAPFQSLELPQNATETVRFSAPTVIAKKYTIRVRAPR